MSRGVYANGRCENSSSVHFELIRRASFWTSVSVLLDCNVVAFRFPEELALPTSGTTFASGVRSFDKERHVTTPQRQMPTVITLSSEHVSEPSRRQFCAHACQAASLVAVSALLPACGGGGDSNPTNPSGGGGTTSALSVITGTVSGRTVSVSVAGSLANPGGAALIQTSLASSPNQFLVFRDSTTAFTVLTAVCTHEGCTVDSFNGQLYTCPCHGSKYTTVGGVANGPANSPLRTFASTLSGTTLTFTV